MLGAVGDYQHFTIQIFAEKQLVLTTMQEELRNGRNLKIKNWIFVNLNALDISKLNFDVNCIINVDFIEHITKKEGIIFIKNCKKFLQNQKNRRNKMLIIGTPSYYSKKYRAKHNLLHHKHEYKPDELYEICAKNFSRVFKFTMNDELVHTGFDKLGWFFFLICIL